MGLRQRLADRLVASKNDKTSYASNAVLTGAGSGIGRAYALELANRGGSAMCADINLKAAAETVEMIAAAGGQARATRCDVSKLVYVEAQIDYIVDAIGQLRQRGLKSMEVKQNTQTVYNIKLQKRLAKTNWNSGCKSWYLTEDGFNSTMYPGFATQFKRQMQLRLGDYAVEKLSRKSRQPVAA